MSPSKTQACVKDVVYDNLAQRARHERRAVALRTRVTLAAALAFCGVAVQSAPASAHGDLHAQIVEVTAALAVELRKPVDGHERANLYLARGELYRQHRKWKKAAADYDAAKRYEPDFDAVDLARGKMLLESGQLSQARRVLEAYLTDHVDHPEALLLAAEVLVKQGRPLAGVALFDRAIARHPQPEPDHFIARAEILERLGPRHRARAIAGLEEGMARLGRIISLQERKRALSGESVPTDSPLQRGSGVRAAPARTAGPS